MLPTKPARKELSSPPSVMFDNGRGTSFSLTTIANIIHTKAGHMFGDFSVYEQNGKLLVDTGMRRVQLDNMCNQPCDGDCERTCG